MFNSFLYVYQGVNLHFPMVFLWFSYGFPIILYVYQGVYRIYKSLWKPMTIPPNLGNLEEEFTGLTVGTDWGIVTFTTRPGKLTKSYWKWLLIVSFPMKHGDAP